MSAEPGQQAILELDRLTLSFGGLRALSELDLQVREREVVSVIGPNGAGKTTVFNVITGVYEPNAGDVRFAGASIAGQAPHVIARLGIARTFQSLRLFLNMSVLENVMAATYGDTKALAWESILRLPRARREEREVRALADIAWAMACAARPSATVAASTAASRRHGRSLASRVSRIRP